MSPQLVARLADARVRAGLSLGQAAQRLGIERRLLSDVEWGRAPLGDLAPKLAAVYQVNVPWLLAEVPEVAPESALAHCCIDLAPGRTRLSPGDKRELLITLASLPHADAKR